MGCKEYCIGFVFWKREKVDFLEVISDNLLSPLMNVSVNNRQQKKSQDITVIFVIY